MMRLWWPFYVAKAMFERRKERHTQQRIVGGGGSRPVSRPGSDYANSKEDVHIIDVTMPTPLHSPR